MLYRACLLVHIVCAAAFFPPPTIRQENMHLEGRTLVFVLALASVRVIVLLHLCTFVLVYLCTRAPMPFLEQPLQEQHAIGGTVAQDNLWKRDWWSDISDVLSASLQRNILCWIQGWRFALRDIVRYYMVQRFIDTIEKVLQDWCNTCAEKIMTLFGVTCVLNWRRRKKHIFTNVNCWLKIPIYMNILFFPSSQQHQGQYHLGKYIPFQIGRWSDILCIGYPVPWPCTRVT